MKRDDSKVRYSCLNIDKIKLMLIYNKGIALDISELTDRDIDAMKKELKTINNDDNIFDREKIFTSRYYGNSLCIVTSNVCQLQCKYCYSSSGEINSNRYIEINAIKKCIDTVFENAKLYKKLSGTKLNFLFHGGGEPTENWPLFKNVVEYIMQKTTNTGSKVFLKIVTNGIMSEKKAQWISEVFDEIVVSIDGPHYINDKIRVFKNQSGSTNISVASANIFASNAKLGIHSVVTSLSVGKAKEIIDFFRNSISNINFINFQRCRNTQDGRNEILSLDVTEYMDFINTALQYAPDLIRTSVADITLKRAFCKGCSGNMIYCFPNGNITVCNEHDNDIYKIGSYKDGVIIDPSLYSNYKSTISQKITKLECEQCFAFPFCRGGCHSYYLQCDNYIEEWCDTFKMLIKRMLMSKMQSAEEQYEYFNGNKLRYFEY